MVYEYTSMIFCYFCKGKQLLWLPVCFPGQCSPFKIGSTHKGKNLVLGEHFFLLEVIPIYMGNNIENDRVASLKVYPFT